MNCGLRRTEEGKKMTDVSIIIPVFQRTEWIKKCIERLLDQDFRGGYEIIVVDDGSPNAAEIQKMVEQYSSEAIPVRYLQKGHAGPAAARNYAVGHAAGMILCFLDDDSLAEKMWLHEIIRPFIFHESAAAVSGRVLSLDQHDGLSFALEKAVYSGKHWATCNIAYKRSVFEMLGGFDESFPEPSWEDNDLGLRTRWAGYRYVYSEKAVVYHPHEKTVDEYKRKCLLNGRGAAVFCRKYIFSKPLWGIGTPLMMSRRLIYGIFPSVWMKRTHALAYLRFLWSLYSLRGFLSSIMRIQYESH
jgi:GT2 family glycosyltransferase